VFSDAANVPCTHLKKLYLTVKCPRMSIVIIVINCIQALLIISISHRYSYSSHLVIISYFCVCHLVSFVMEHIFYAMSMLIWTETPVSATCCDLTTRVGPTRLITVFCPCCTQFKESNVICISYTFEDLSIEELGTRTAQLSDWQLSVIVEKLNPPLIVNMQVT